MNKSNYQCPPSPQNCCCSCPKNDYSPRGGRGAKYIESSPNEDDDDDDDCGNQNFRNNESSFGRDEVYDNLIDLIDDQMMSTMSTLRKKARKFMKSELENSFSSDTTSRPCTCPEEIRSRGTKVAKKANEIDYQPQSRFLKKMVQQYQGRQNDCSEYEDSDSPTMVEKRSKLKKKQRSPSKTKSPPIVEQKEKPSGCCCCPCKKDSPDGEIGGSQDKQKKSEHLSRSKKKTKCRGKKRRKSDGKCESGDQFEVNLKQPHENSCERCWRYASPSRSPVNKPDQRYDPNFRRGHSSVSLAPEKENDLIDEKGNRTSPCKDLQSAQITPDVTKNVRSYPNALPSEPNKFVQFHKTPCEEYSSRYNPFTEQKEMPCRQQPTKRYTEMSGLDFEYKSPRPPEPMRPLQQKYSSRPHSCEKTNQGESFERGIIYSSSLRNPPIRPQSFTLGTNNYTHGEECASAIGSLPYKDVCGRGTQQYLDPCMKRSRPAKTTPCQGRNMSAVNGDSSRGSGGLGSGGLGSDINTSKRSLDQSRDGMSKSTQGVQEVDRSRSEERRRTGTPPYKDSSPQKEASTLPVKKSKTGDKKEKVSKKKLTPSKKSPKSKSPSKTPKESPRGSKDKKSSPRDNKRRPCSTNEAQAYFKIPTKPKSPERCGVAHPIRNCQCYPRTVNTSQNDEIYCCHCDWQENAKNEFRAAEYDQSDSSRPSGGCCSPNRNSPESATLHGRRLTPTSNRGHIQAPTLPNIDEYPEQLFENSPAFGGDIVLPCPYRFFMNNQLLNNMVSENETSCERNNAFIVNGNVSHLSGNSNSCCRKENVTYIKDDGNACPRNGNASYRSNSINTSRVNGNGKCARHGNASQINGNVNCARYGNGNFTGYGNGNVNLGNYSANPQMNAGCEMEYPRKYCVMYMTKGKEEAGDEVEVLVEELTQPCPYEKDDRMKDVSDKMTRVFKCPTDSMALRFQKGVSERGKVPEKSRVLYF